MVWVAGFFGRRGRRQQQTTTTTTMYTIAGIYMRWKLCAGRLACKRGFVCEHGPRRRKCPAGDSRSMDGELLGQTPHSRNQFRSLSLMCCGRVCFSCCALAGCQQVLPAPSHMAPTSPLSLRYLLTVLEPLPRSRTRRVSYLEETRRVSESCLLRRAPGRSDFYASVFVPYCAV